jgi:hypothetical protein
MPPASRLVESVFERFVAEDGLEERVYHLGHDPYRSASIHLRIRSRVSATTCGSVERIW